MTCLKRGSSDVCERDLQNRNERDVISQWGYVAIWGILEGMVR